MIAVAGVTFQTDAVLAGVIIIAGTSLVVTLLFRRIEAHFQSWKPKAQPA